MTGPLTALSVTARRGAKGVALRCVAGQGGAVEAEQGAPCGTGRGGVGATGRPQRQEKGVGTRS